MKPFEVPSERSRLYRSKPVPRSIPVTWSKTLEVRVAKAKTLEERLWGAAVLKMSFRLRGAEESPAFKAIYPGVLRDLDLEDPAVEQFIAANKERVEKAAKGSTQE